MRLLPDPLACLLLGLLAWYGKRRGLLLPQREEDLARLERLGSIDAAYVTAALAQVPLEERGDWWLWVATPQGIYHGLAPAASMPPNAILRWRNYSWRMAPIGKSVRSTAKRKCRA